jgi:FkbM family methyltransferase
MKPLSILYAYFRKPNLWTRIGQGLRFRFLRAYFRLHRDYSQSGETVAIRKILRDTANPFFVEVGANDGRFVSSTYGLMLDGWKGLCIEPHPGIFEKLRKNIARFDQVKAVCCAASPERGKLRLFLGKDDSRGVFSTISSEDSEWHRAHRDEAFVMVDGKPLSDILAEHDVPPRFGLLLVDAEGMDLEVLRTLDFETYRPQLIVTEDYAPKNETKFAFLESHAFRFLQRIGCNTFWIDERSRLQTRE